MAEVESHPFALDTMLFMDWRDDFTAGDSDMAVRHLQLSILRHRMPRTGVHPVTLMIQLTTVLLPAG